jgi:hypothetical protein
MVKDWCVINEFKQAGHSLSWWKNCSSGSVTSKLLKKAGGAWDVPRKLVADLGLEGDAELDEKTGNCWLKGELDYLLFYYFKDNDVFYIRRDPDALHMDDILDWLLANNYHRWIEVGETIVFAKDKDIKID